MIEAMKKVLETLERSVATCFDQYSHQQVMSQPDHFINQAITSLRQAIAEAEKQEQGEPVQVTIKDFVKAVEGKEHLMGRPVYWAQWPNGNTTPQPRTWVELTQEEIYELWQASRCGVPRYSNFASLIDAKLKEKNSAST